MPVRELGTLRVDFSDAGQGDTVVLIHSSVSGNRQWKCLVQALQAHYRVLALNLFGYGETSAWPGATAQTLDDQAGLVLGLLRELHGPVRLVGHSFGGSVACRVAIMLGPRASHLFLFEPTLFHLLAQNGCRDAYAEAAALRDFIRDHGSRGDWERAAEYFVDYWIGAGAWAAMPEERRITFTQRLRPNYDEWDSVDRDQTAIEALGALRAKAMIAYAPAARRPILEIADLLWARCPGWGVTKIAEGGHMAPLTHPHLVNPLIAGFLHAS